MKIFATILALYALMVVIAILDHKNTLRRLFDSQRKDS